MPENRNSGRIPNRKIALNLLGVYWVVAKAAIGVANAMPVRTAAGMAKTIVGAAAAPKAMMTSVKTVEIIVSRAAIQARLPTAMSRTEMGVAAMAWKTLLHRIPDMIGNVDSKAADCMAVAASSPGARNWM